MTGRFYQDNDLEERLSFANYVYGTSRLGFEAKHVLVFLILRPNAILLERDKVFWGLTGYVSEFIGMPEPDVIKGFAELIGRFPDVLNHWTRCGDAAIKFGWSDGGQ